MLKIAISGKANVGKNTAASLITSDVLNLNESEYKVSAFANPIKQIIELMFPDCNKNCLYGASELRQNKISTSISKHISIDTSYRQATIAIGKMGRSFNESFWVAHLAKEVEEIEKNKQIKAYIVSDVRFIEEYEWLKRNGFCVFRIKRDTDFAINDVSEHGQDLIPDHKFDFIINNNGSIKDLSRILKSNLSNFINK